MARKSSADLRREADVQDAIDHLKDAILQLKGDEPGHALIDIDCARALVETLSAKPLSVES